MSSAMTSQGKEVARRRKEVARRSQGRCKAYVFINVESLGLGTKQYERFIVSERLLSNTNITILTWINCVSHFFQHDVWLEQAKSVWQGWAGRYGRAGIS